MKASDLIVKAKSIEEIEKEIKEANENGSCMIMINPFVRVEMETINKLILNGFAVRKVKDMNGVDMIIIEW
ncbi:MAG: hypothetical protein LKI39_02625 [Bacteroides sp.]|jgi:hypothetical protein|nr:hypothetical protein [Bacteroides sp.]